MLHTYFGGGDRVFPITFDFLKPEYIHVYINGTELESANYELDEKNVIINVELYDNDLITIQRKTSLEPEIVFTGRNDLKSVDLNFAITQILHLMQEEDDNSRDLLSLNPAGNWDAENKKLTNLAPAVEDTDAVRKDQILSLTYDGIGELETKVNNLISAVQTKGEPNGFAELDTNGLIPKKNLPVSISPLPAFSVNSGRRTPDGKADLLSVDNNILKAHAPFTYTTANGYTFTQLQDVIFDIKDFTYGIYNIFINPETQTIELFENKIYKQDFFPPELADGDIWLDTSIQPYVSYVKTAQGLASTMLVPLGTLEIPEPIEIIP